MKTIVNYIFISGLFKLATLPTRDQQVARNNGISGSCVPPEKLAVASGSAWFSGLLVTVDKRPNGVAKLAISDFRQPGFNVRRECARWRGGQAVHPWRAVAAGSAVRPPAGADTDLAEPGESALMEVLKDHSAQVPGLLGPGIRAGVQKEDFALAEGRTDIPGKRATDDQWPGAAQLDIGRPGGMARHAERFAQKLVSPAHRFVPFGRHIP